MAGALITIGVTAAAESTVKQQLDVNVAQSELAKQGFPSVTYPVIPYP